MGNVHMEAKDINYRGGQKKMSVEEALKNTSGEAAAIAQLQSDVADLNDTKANFAAYAMGGNATVNIYHYSMAIVMSDRGGLYFDGSSNRGLQALVPSEAVTVTHVDGTNLTVTNNSQYGTNIIVLSDGDITISAVS